MKIPLFFLTICILCLSASVQAADFHQPPAEAAPAAAESVWRFSQFNEAVTRDGMEFSARFLAITPLFQQVLVLVLVLVPLPFLLHFLIIREMEFSHYSPGVYYFSLFIRLVHWLAALSFSLLVITGLVMTFGNFIGGDLPVRLARYVHLGSAMLFAVALLPMFFTWLRDMLPAPWDIQWLLILGGYLSREKISVPAGKFNAGQKIWFWLVSLGGVVMLISGYMLYSFQAAPAVLAKTVIIHNFLAALLLAFYIVHLYMSLLAIKGSIFSMLSGYKSQEEVDILHPKYNSFRP